MCLSPLQIQYKPKRKSLRIYDTQYIEVPCGKCTECLEFKIQQRLSSLLLEFITNNQVASFATITYDEQHVKPTGVDKTHLKDLIEYCRDKDIKITISSEYGSNTNRPHYHIVAFTDLDTLCYILDKTWKLGNYQASVINLARFRYQCNSHITKQSHIPYSVDVETGELFSCNAAFTYSSRGIGYKYVDMNYQHIFNNMFIVNLFGMHFKIPDNLQRRVLKRVFNQNEFAVNSYKRNIVKMRDACKSIEKYERDLLKKMNLPASTSRYELYRYQYQYIQSKNSQFYQKYKQKSTNRI